VAYFYRAKHVAYLPVLPHKHSSGRGDDYEEREAKSEEREIMKECFSFYKPAHIWRLSTCYQCNKIGLGVFNGNTLKGKAT
jgi:hypothetical protein